MKKLLAWILALTMLLGCTAVLAEGEPIWYSDNHATVFGPQIDGDWKTYAVLDLSRNGTKALMLIGSGAWKLGTVTVTVAEDTAVVDYCFYDAPGAPEVRVDSEYLNLYTELPSADAICQESAFRFGESFSISEAFGGQTIVTMYVEMQVDYASADSGYRFWPNVASHRVIAEEMAYDWAHRED